LVSPIPLVSWAAVEAVTPGPLPLFQSSLELVGVGLAGKRLAVGPP
jgi:hypothetical protein